MITNSSYCKHDNYISSCEKCHESKSRCNSNPMPVVVGCNSYQTQNSQPRISYLRNQNPSQVMIVNQNPSPRVMIVNQNPSPRVMIVNQNPSPQVMVVRHGNVSSQPIFVGVNTNPVIGFATSNGVFSFR